MRSRREVLWASGALPLLASLAPGRPAPASDRKVRLGVVGGGFGTNFYFHEHPNCEVAAVTDLRADRRARLRNTYRCDTVYDSLEEMLGKEKRLDAVAIFTGAPDHFRHATLCLERGLHVLSAVPAVMSLEEAEKLVAVKSRSGRRYMMAETSYYRQPVIYARTLFQQGGFGELFYSELEYYHDRGDPATLLTDKTTRYYEPDGSRSRRWGFAALDGGPITRSSATTFTAIRSGTSAR